MKYNKFIKEFEDSLPMWYNEGVHNEVLRLMNDGKQLDGIRYLTEQSVSLNTRRDYGMTWAKMVTDTIKKDKIDYNAVWLKVKRYFNDAILIIGLILLPYIFFSGINWDFNPGNWGTFSRFLSICYYLLLGTALWSTLSK